MSDARQLMRDYLRQQMELGEERVVLRQVGAAGAGPLQSSSAGGEHRSAPAASDDRPTTPQPKWMKGAPPIPDVRGIVVARPPKDLFTVDPLAKVSLEELADMVRACTKCALCENRTNGVPGEGPGDAKLMVVGEGPGAVEDETGRPFVGRAGELLTEILAAIEWPRERVFICNIVKCRPPSNRKPLQPEIDACVPYLHRQIELVQPAVILAMGGTAAETLLGVKQSLGQLRNQVHEFWGTPLLVTYHPAALLRNPHWKKPTWDDVRIARQLIDQRR